MCKANVTGVSPVHTERASKGTPVVVKHRDWRHLFEKHASSHYYQSTKFRRDGGGRQPVAIENSIRVEQKIASKRKNAP